MMAQPTSEDQPAPVFSVSLTDPTRVVTISTDSHIRDNRPVALTASIQDFFDALSVPDPKMRRKDGPGFYNGFCSGKRSQANFDRFRFAVLDADSSIEEDGRIVDGAPAPRDVHHALSSLGLTHHIYTTHSHGGHKGHRYRVVFPCETSSRAELRAVILYFHERISESGLPLALSRESYTVPNRWHFPRTEDADAPFYAKSFYGYEIDQEGVQFLARHYRQVGSDGNEIVGNTPYVQPERTLSGSSSLLDTFCAAFKIEDMLFAHGYTYHGPYLMTDTNGREVQALRFKKPDSKNGPGVIVFDAGSKQRLYSHHTNDKLATGRAMDAFDVYMILNDVENSMRHETAVMLLQEYEIERMNLEYPTILVGGSKFRFAHVVMTAAGSMKYSYMAPIDYKMSVTNQPGVYEVKINDDGEQKILLSDRYNWWVTQRQRTVFKNIIFKPIPMQECLGRNSSRFHEVVNGDSYFNLFTGWPTKPVQGPWPLMQWHILHALCGGNQAHYEYFLDWMAHMLQYPLSKPNVALVLRGRKGTGKSIIMSAVAKYLGPLGMVISHSKHLTGSFNSHLREKLFALVEESFFSGSPSEEGALKHMISDKETTYEAKGYDAESGLSFLRVGLITNNEWAAPASDDERRYFIPTVTDAAIIRNSEEGGTFFTRLSQEIAGGGLSAMFYDLMHRNISEQAVRKAPDSEELQRQKLLTLSGVGAWILDTMILGVIPSEKGGVPVPLEAYPRTTSIKADTVVESVNRYLKIHDVSRSQLLRVRETLKTVLKVTTETRGTDLHLVFPALEEMRESFCRHYKVPPQW